MKKLIISLLLAACSGSMYAQQLTLERCRTLALENNEGLRKAGLGTEGAKLDRQIAVTDYLPRLSGSATGACLYPDKKSDLFELSLKGMYMAGFSIQQPLFAGGGIVAANKMAALNHEMSKDQLRQKRQSVITETDRIYWNYVAVQEKVKLLKEYIILLDSIYRQTEVRMYSEYSTRSDLLRIESRRSQAQYNLKKAENGAEICRMALCHQTGLELNTPVTTTETLTSLQAGVTDNPAATGSITNRPEYSLLQRRIAFTEQEVKKVRSGFLPSLGLGVNYNWVGNIKIRQFTEDADGRPLTNNSTYDTHTGSVLLSLSVPLFHFGEGSKKVKRARLNVQTAQLDFSEKQRQMQIEREEALRNLLNGRTLIGVAATGQAQADENLRILQVRYAQDYATLTDLMDAQTQWQEAHYSLIEALTQYKVYETEYRRVAGLME